MTAPARDLHQRHAAAIYRAIGLRFFLHYAVACESVKYRGGDLGGEPVPSHLEIATKYETLINEWLFESVSTADEAVALIEFATVLALDHLINESLDEPAPLGREMDANHQVVALSQVREWLMPQANAEAIAREQQKAAKNLP